MDTLAPRGDGLQELARQVARRSPFPHDHYEVAAIVESLGWTDHQVQTTFGYPDVFALARAIYDGLKAAPTVLPHVPRKTLPWHQALGRAVRHFFRGLVFALPMAVSVAAMLVVRYSLWAYQYFTLEVATAVAIATMLSLLVTGGFIQSIARRGLMYVEMDEYNAARRVTMRLMAVGTAVAMLVGLGFGLVNLVFLIYPWRMVGWALLYYLLLCTVWLAVGLLYILKRELLLTVIFALGIAAVGILHEVFRLTIMLAQGLALAFTSGASLLVARRTFATYERRRVPGVEYVPLPRPSLLLYTLLPYFIYGFGYFLLLYTDRILAWTADAPYMPYFFWFRGDYELGLDWAILILVLPLGVVEMAVVRFGDLLRQRQALHPASDVEGFNRWFLAFHTRWLWVFAAVVTASAALVYWGTIAVDRSGVLAVPLFANRISYWVFGWAVLGYALIAAGLMNVLLLFCLSRPEPVLRVLGLAWLVDVVVGFVMSRQLGYQWAVCGLVAGALAFFLQSTYWCRSILRELDYQYYASL